MRKVEPLRKKLASLDAWIAAIRRDQSSARADAGKIQWDNKFQLVKDQSACRLDEKRDLELRFQTRRSLQFPARPELPQHRLHPLHPSGKPGEDSRAGRWAGFSKTECGLHLETPEATAPLVQIGSAGGND